MENKTGGLTLLSIWSEEKLSKHSCGFPCPPIDEFGGQSASGRGNSENPQGERLHQFRFIDQAVERYPDRKIY